MTNENKLSLEQRKVEALEDIATLLGKLIGVVVVIGIAIVAPFIKSLIF